MLKALKNEANKTYTENGAVSNRTSGKDCLDLFATIGALRRESEQEIVTRFVRAYAENADIAMKILMVVKPGFKARRRASAIKASSCICALPTFDSFL